MGRVKMGREVKMWKKERVRGHRRRRFDDVFVFFQFMFAVVFVFGAQTAVVMERVMSMVVRADCTDTFSLYNA
jgi:hypothetical protein